MKKETKNIGIKTSTPDKLCNDIHCPFHGSIKCRGRIFKGTVVGTRMQKTVVVEWTRKKYIPKFERYEFRRSKVKAHNPECINAKEGDIVVLSECRPISKTKHLVVIDVLGKEKGFIEKMESLEEGKTRKIESEKEEQDESHEVKSE